MLCVQTFSCPAVSQIWKRMEFSPTLTVFVVKAALGVREEGGGGGGGGGERERERKGVREGRGGRGGRRR